MCVCFPHSKTSRSGYHYVTVFSNAIAVDTLLTPEDSIKGKVARFNRTNISNTEDYFSSEKNRGYVFDITDMIGNYQIFKMYMDYLDKIQKNFSLPQPIMASNEIPEQKAYSWAEVSSTTTPVRNSKKSLSDSFEKSSSILSRKRGRSV